MRDFSYLLSKCAVCPRNCNVNRLKNELGFCKIGRNPKISSCNLHFGEEPPISGINGSGTIFFTGCNLRCVFCQNYPISQLYHGNEITVEKLAEIMMTLQNQNANNINLVTPTHVVPQIIEAVLLAKNKGSNIPIVYNSGGYEKVETLKLLNGIIDIYMPDAKYSDDRTAEKYSDAKNYWKVNKLTLKEMHKQVGNLQIKNGVATKGLLIRHLVLPNNIASSKKVFEFIAKEISPKTYISIMAQYHPANKTDEFPELQRKITDEEYSQVLNWADEFGLINGWRQELCS
ncbi:MAG: radical SAM protein [Elusimicrobia bacterium HGW-Elusimicrobia-4]|nr:MAG: radical SAM protein [Elusimicrobia bacterium HGW-Elusimicrobia-4]